ncbi:MAG TPA: FKBP-type peptidyl-prolyl cis-trans isomerase [Nakamurella sp.]|jgi:peptidylprolyl isomerase
MRVRALAVAVPLALGVLLAGCSSGGDSTTPSSSATTTPPTLGPTVPAATAVAAAVPADQLPTASGSFGEKPTLTFPATDPPPSLQRVILSEGTGPLTQSGDWLITNYLGQVWGGAVFDNSYDRGATSAFQIGVGKVVPGWDVGLVGVPVGSRVMLSLPPADGYGSTGNSSAGIKSTDNLVFVVDIVNAVSATTSGQADAEVQPAPANAPQVSGALGGPATVSVPAGTPEPTTPVVTVLAKGTGAPIQLGQVLVQYSAVTWTGEDAGSTWTDATSGGGPQELPVATGGPFEGLVGVPLGSRVLVQIPSQSDTSTGQSQPSIAAVVDVLVQTTVTPATTPSGSAAPSGAATGSAAPTS